MDSGARRWLVVVAPVVAVVAHWAAIAGGFTNWDDPIFLLNNPLTTSPLGSGVGHLLTTPELSYAVPVTVLFYALERALFDLSPAAFHAVSVLLHAGVVAAIVILAVRLGVAVWAATVAALLFAVHPLVVEPVAWVTGQKDLLAALFLLSALCLRAGPRGQQWPRATVVALLSILAIGCKPSAVGVAILLAGLDYAVGRQLRRQLWLYGVIVTVAIVSVVLAFTGHAQAEATAPTYGFEATVHAGWAFALQLQHLVWPTLRPRYFPPTGSELWLWFGCGSVLFACMTTGAVVLWRKDRRLLAFCVAAFLVAYAPTSGIIRITRGPADSYLYLPMAFAVIAGGALLGKLTGRGRTAAIAVVVAVSLLLAWVSSSQIKIWKTSTTLWAHLVDGYPEDPRARTRLGDAFAYARQPDKAEEQYRLTLRASPEHLPARLGLGLSLEAMGTIEQAELELARAARHPSEQVYRENYAFFLTRHRLRPSDPETARTSLVELEPLLSSRGKRLQTVVRASRLLHELGEVAAAQRLIERARVLEGRAATTPPE